MITDVENIILNKEYFELTPEELTAVSDLVQSAEEYEEMKWFLMSSQTALAGEQIEASPELKDKVMDYLHQDEKNRKFWLNSVGAFLWPEEKRFYQKPAFQMSLAALLIIGFIMVYDKPLDEGEMAINDTTIQPEGEGKVSEIITTDETSIDEDTEGDFLADEIGSEELSEDMEIEEVMVNRMIASGESEDEIIDKLEVVDLEEAPITDMDGYYMGPIEEEADEVVSGMDQDPVVQNNKDFKSLSNANNKELDNKGGGSGKKPGGGDLALDDSKNGRDELKKSDAKKNKDKDKRRYKNVESRNDVDADDVDIVTVNNNEGNNNTVAQEENSYNFGNNTGGVELNQNTANEPVGGSYSGNVQTESLSNTVPATTVDNGVNDQFDGNAVVKEQQVITPYQLHVNQTKELKSLFKTSK